MSQSVDIGIADEQLGEIVHGLSRVLADSYSLYLKSHSYHWNVVGPMFHSLHTMFMDEYSELALAVDEIAERIRALGAPAPGTYRQFAEFSLVAEDTDLPDAQEMVRRLVAAHEATARTIRETLLPRCARHQLGPGRPTRCRVGTSGRGVPGRLKTVRAWEQVTSERQGRLNRL